MPAAFKQQVYYKTVQGQWPSLPKQDLSDLHINYRLLMKLHFQDSSINYHKQISLMVNKTIQLSDYVWQLIEKNLKQDCPRTMAQLPKNTMTNNECMLHSHKFN